MGASYGMPTAIGDSLMETRNRSQNPGFGHEKVLVFFKILLPSFRFHTKLYQGSGKLLSGCAFKPIVRWISEKVGYLDFSDTQLVESKEQG